MDGRKVVSLEKMTAKIRAAVRARKDKDMLIILRTDAISVLGFEKAVHRGKIYREAGSDIVFIDRFRLHGP